MRHAILTFLSISLLGVVSCETAAPELGDVYNAAEMYVIAPDAYAQRDVAPAQLQTLAVAFVNGARETLVIALEDFENDAVAQALVSASQRGVDVRVVGDADLASQSGFRTVRDQLPEGSVVFGDGQLAYAPEPTINLNRSGAQNRMTHNFMVADGQRVLALSNGFSADNDRYQWGFEIDSNDLAEDFGREFNVMYSGTFAATTDTFGGPHKSDTNNRVFYFTQHGYLGLYFGPQERLMKRVIDDAYGATSSIRIVTESFTNQFLLDALRYKASIGYTVQVVVDAESIDAENSLADELAEFVDVRTADDIRMNMVIIDAEPNAMTGVQNDTRVYLLTEPMLASTSFYPVGSGYRTQAADGFTDAHMFELRPTDVLPHPGFASSMNLFDFLFNGGSEL